MGALLLARLNLLQETIHSYISADARVYPGISHTHGAKAMKSSCICDIAIQLALQRRRMDQMMNRSAQVWREWSQKEENRFGHSGFDNIDSTLRIYRRCSSCQ